MSTKEQSAKHSPLTMDSTTSPASTSCSTGSHFPTWDFVKPQFKHNQIQYLFFFGKLSHFHRTAVEGRWADALLESMDAASRAIARQEEGPARTSRLARMMAATADLLGAMARGCGGLRSGPAHNQTFSPALALVEAGRLEEGLEGLMRAREGWLAEPRLLVRLARHYEGAVQALVRQTILSAREQVGSPERAFVS